MMETVVDLLHLTPLSHSPGADDRNHLPLLRRPVGHV